MSAPVILSAEARKRLDLAYDLIERPAIDAPANSPVARVGVILAKLLDDADAEIVKVRGHA